MPGAAKIPLYEQETVLFDVATRRAVITRQPLNQEIAAFWSRNAFRQTGTPAQSTHLAQGGHASLPALGAYPVGTTSTPRAGIPALPVSSGQSNVDYSGYPGYPGYSGVPSSGFPTDGVPSGGAFQSPQTNPKDTAFRGANFDVMSTERATLRPKNNGIIVGTLLITAGILMQAVGHYNVLGLETDIADVVYLGGYAPVAFGLVTLIGTYIYSYKN
jgi:hypothetical protein